MPLAELPVEILCAIASHLDYSALTATRWSCKFLYAVLERSHSECSYDMIGLLRIVRWLTFDANRPAEQQDAPDRFACCFCLRVRGAYHFESQMIPDTRSSFSRKYWFNDQFEERYLDVPDVKLVSGDESDWSDGSGSDDFDFEPKEESEDELEHAVSREDADVHFYGDSYDWEEGAGLVTVLETRKVYRYDHSFCLDCGVASHRYFPKKKRHRKPGHPRLQTPETWLRVNEEFQCTLCNFREIAGLHGKHMSLCRKCTFDRHEIMAAMEASTA